MARGQQVVKYEGFEGGEQGSLSAELAGRREMQMYAGLNVMRYRNGLLGPRAGLKKYTLTSMPNGAVLGMGYNGTPGCDLWFVIGTAVKRLSLTSIATTVASFTGAVTTPTRPAQGVETYTERTALAIPGDKVYELNHTAFTCTALTGSPNPDALCLYGERLLVAGRDDQRVYYSDPGAFGTWGASSYFDVGNGPAVRGLFQQRGHLSIAMQDGSWWVLNGTPGTSAVLRRVTGGGVHPWHVSPNSMAMLGNDEVLFVPTSSDFPALFNGALVDDEGFRHVGLLNLRAGGYGQFADVKVLRGYRPDEGAFLWDSTDQMALFRHKTWSFHTFSVPITDNAASDGQGHLILSGPGTAGTAAAIYNLSIALERPAFTSDTFASVGDDSSTVLTAEVVFPEWWEENGHEVTVRSVIVDFVKWSTGASQTNHFDVSVSALRRYVTDSPVDSAVQAWDEAGASASVDGIRDRVHLNFGDQGKGGGFTIKLAAIRGVAIRSVAVVVDVWERRT